MGPLLADSSCRRLSVCNLLPAIILISVFFFVMSTYIRSDYNEKLPMVLTANRVETNKSDYGITQSNKCKIQCKPLGSEPLPKGIVSQISDLEMEPLLGSPEIKGNKKPSKNLIAIPVGIKQKELVDKVVTKFLSAGSTIMLFHYDGVVDKWNDLQWSDTVIHVTAINQTKWWFAKRFLHPDIVAEYNYIFLWDEDLEVNNFHPIRYLEIVKQEGLEISQPALDSRTSRVHHKITVRQRNGDVHRRFYKLNGGGRCYQNSNAPPCTGWVEMMAPVFSRVAWRCVWNLIQNDLIYAWGLDYKLGYCAQGDRSLNVGVVDSEYIVHRGIPSLGALDENKVQPGGTKSTENDRYAMRLRSYAEMQVFNKRWQKAVAEDKCWTDLYPEQNGTSKL